TVTYFIGLKRNGRFHGNEAKQLQQMVLYHIAERSGCFVIISTVFNAQLFRYGYLNAVDIVAVPGRFEECIGKPEGENILYGFLTQIMVDTVNLALIKDGMQQIIQMFGAVEVMPERLFNNNPAR